MSRAPAERTISVVVATHDAARFVEQQLDSIARQTLPPSELLVGDDELADDTLAVVERFTQRAPFPVHVQRNQPRLGATENFLALIGRARSPIVALSDWDDVWLPSKLERAAPWFDDPRVGLVVHRATVVDADLVPTGRRYPTFTRTAVLPARRADPWLATPGMGMVVRRALVTAVGQHGAARPSEAGGHPMDHDDWLYLLSTSFGTTVLLAEDLLLYRQHGASYMGAPEGDVRERLDRGLRLAADDFRRQAGMFRARQAWLQGVAADVTIDVGVRREATASAVWAGEVAELQARRAEGRDLGRTRTSRLRSVLGLLVRGGYRARTHAGLGARALAGDVLGLASGTAAPSAVLAPDDRQALIRRVAEARASGRAAAEIAEDLTRDGVPALYGRRWTTQMIRDLVFEARRTDEAAAIQGGAEPPTGST